MRTTRKDSKKSLPPKGSLVISHIFQSRILEDSLISIFRCRIKIYSKSQKKSKKVPRAGPALMLFTTCPFLALQPWPQLPSYFTPSVAPHTCPVLSWFVHPAWAACSSPPPTLCQVPECTAFLKAWLKNHLFWDTGRVCHSLPSMPQNDTLHACPLPDMSSCSKVNVLMNVFPAFLWTKGMEWVYPPQVGANIK